MNAWEKNVNVFDLQYTKISGEICDRFWSSVVVIFKWDRLWYRSKCFTNERKTKWLPKLSFYKFPIFWAIEVHFFIWLSYCTWLEFFFRTHTIKSHTISSFHVFWTDYRGPHIWPYCEARIRSAIMMWISPILSCVCMIWVRKIAQWWFLCLPRMPSVSNLGMVCSRRKCDKTITCLISGRLSLVPIV